jgi:hypothetical protein
VKRDPLIEVQLPDAECSCDLESRQQAASREAALLGREDPRLWHNPSCGIALRIELRKTLEQIAARTDKQVLPDPVLEAMQEAELADLLARRDGLLSRLGGRSTTAPSRQVVGYDQETGHARLGPAKGNP